MMFLFFLKKKNDKKQTNGQQQSTAPTKACSIPKSPFFPNIDLDHLFNEYFNVNLLGRHQCLLLYNSIWMTRQYLRQYKILKTSKITLTKIPMNCIISFWIIKYFTAFQKKERNLSFLYHAYFQSFIHLVLPYSLPQPRDDSSCSK